MKGILRHEIAPASGWHRIGEIGGATILVPADDCPFCRAKKAEHDLMVLEDLATRLTAEITVEWSGMARSLCDAINAGAAARAAEEEGK